MSVTEMVGNRHIRLALERLLLKQGPWTMEACADLGMVNLRVCGLAFDYLLRVGLQQMFDVPARPFRIEFVRGGGSADVTGDRDILRTVREVCGRLEQGACDIVSGQLTGDVADAALRLAELEIRMRGTARGTSRSAAWTQERHVLLESIRRVPWDAFAPRRRLVLNPTFGTGSDLVGGADADIILDDSVIEVKMLRDGVVDRQHMLQVIVYATLANHYGVNGDGEPDSITRVGFYSACAGRLELRGLEKLLNKGREEEVIRIFKNAARTTIDTL